MLEFPFHKIDDVWVYLGDINIVEGAEVSVSRDVDNLPIMVANKKKCKGWKSLLANAKVS